MTTRRTALGLMLGGGLFACSGLVGIDESSPRSTVVDDGGSPPVAASDGGSDGDATDARAPAPRLLASNWYHTCAARAGGGLHCFGNNEHGELGDGTTTNRATPTLVAGNPVVESVATGLEHTCILQKAGVVRCWGSNAKGQLGDLTNTPRSSIGEAVLGNFVFVGAGMYHTCALTQAGEVRCWGDNYFGSIGDTTREHRNYATPVLVSTGGQLTDVVSLGVGGWHNCAAVKNGTVYCWGYNRYGQIGYETPQEEEEDHSPVATLVQGIDRVVQITAGENHTCARRDDKSVWCWGRNDTHALGDGTMVDVRISPGPTVGALSGVVDLVTGVHDSCAILADRTTRCWGYNAFGQLATGSVDTGSSVPGSPIAGLNGIQLLSTGDHACAFDGDNALRCWGRNDYGQLGFETGGDPVLTPTVVPF